MKYDAIAIRGGQRWDGQSIYKGYSAAPHDTAKKGTERYTKIIDELPTIRRDIVNLVNHSIQEKRQAYVLVDNRWESKRAADVQALVERLQTDS